MNDREQERDRECEMVILKGGGVSLVEWLVVRLIRRLL